MPRARVAILLFCLGTQVDETGAPHVGGNQWAGGTGGRDTAGLGGKGGPYRLSDGNPIYQISDEEKKNVSPEALQAAKEMAAKAWEERLREIDMSAHEAERYQKLLAPVAREVPPTPAAAAALRSSRPLASEHELLTGAPSVLNMAGAAAARAAAGARGAG